MPGVFVYKNTRHIFFQNLKSKLTLFYTGRGGGIFALSLVFFVINPFKKFQIKLTFSQNLLQTTSENLKLLR